jgi:hypothetical protein
VYCVHTVKVRPKISGCKDVRKSRHLRTMLLKKSSKVLSKLFKPGLSRVETPTTKVKLNIRGNRRGMHLADNPPESEEMRKRRAMRRLWNKQMPELQCSTCQFSSQCPQYRAGYVCAFLPFLNSHQIEDEKDLLFYAKELCGENVKRAQLMLIMERLSGAKPDIDTSEALALVFNQIMDLHQRFVDQDTTTLELESSDGTIIGRLFGGLDSLIGRTREAHKNPIQTPQYEGEIRIDEQVVRPTKKLTDKQKKPHEDLIGELAFLKSNTLHPEKELVPVMSAGKSQLPTQEELPA